MTKRPPALAGREIIIEVSSNPPFVRVAAVDVETGLEAHASGPTSAPEAVERMALGKLARRLARDEHGAEQHSDAPSKRRGRWV